MEKVNEKEQQQKKRRVHRKNRAMERRNKEEIRERQRGGTKVGRWDWERRETLAHFWKASP